MLFCRNQGALLRILELFSLAVLASGVAWRRNESVVSVGVMLHGDLRQPLLSPDRVSGCLVHRPSRRRDDRGNADFCLPRDRASLPVCACPLPLQGTFSILCHDKDGSASSAPLLKMRFTSNISVQRKVLHVCMI